MRLDPTVSLLINIVSTFHFQRRTEDFSSHLDRYEEPLICYEGTHRSYWKSKRRINI